MSIIGTRPETNLTGGQIQQIMDKLLYDSVYLLMPHGIFDNILVTILSSLVMDKRRKISNTEYQDGINLLCNLALRATKRPFEDLKNLKLERTVYLQALTSLVEIVEKKNYVRHYEKWLTTNDKASEKRLLWVENAIGIDRPHLFYAYSNVKLNLELFMEFKSSILKQYINLTHKYASAHIKHKNKNLNYDDLFQNIVTAVSKALDKYDSSKGALTSYIKYWIINALNQDNSHGEGLAYEVSSGQRHKMATGKSNDVNFSSSLSDSENKIADDNTPESLAEYKSSNDRLLRIIKSADIDGIFRLVNNIDECLSTEELKLMSEHMNSEWKKIKKLRSKLSKKGCKAQLGSTSC